MLVLPFSQPDSGKFMAALMRRRIPVILPIVALTTLVSGITPPASQRLATFFSPADTY